MNPSSDNTVGQSATAGTEASRVFVGRERELGDLRAGLEIAISGRGRLFLVAGEPGIGKTRLLDELAAHAPQRDARVLWGRCWEGEGAPAYWPWVQIIRSYVRATDAGRLRSEMGAGAADIAQIITEVRERLPDLKDPPPLQAEHARFRFFDSLASFLRNAAASEPLVLILDDLHWADKASLLLLRFLAGEMAESRLLVAGAYRDVEVQRGHPLTEVLPDLRRQAVHQRILLRGLPVTDVRKLVTSLGAEGAPEAFVKVVFRETEGNPFFVGEILQHLVELGSVRHEDGRWTSRVSPEEMGIPESIRDVIGRRLNRLSQACNEVLAVASVIGREFGMDVLERVSDDATGRLQELLSEAVAARVIAEAPRAHRRYSFSHALIREALYGELHTPTRLRLHRRIAEVLEEIHARDPEPHLSELAYHFFEAAHGTSDVERAIDYAERAGKRAASLHAYDEAGDQYRRALELLDAGEPREPRRLDLLLALGDALRRAGDLDRAKEAFLRAATIGTKLGSPGKLARAALGHAGRWMSTGLGDEVTVRLLREALVALPEGDSALRSALMARLGPELYWHSPRAEAFEEAFEMTREAIDMARRSGDSGALAYALGAPRLTMYDALDLDKAQIGTEVGRLARSVGDNEAALLGREWRIHGFVEVGDIDAADTEIEAFAREAEDLRQPFYLWRVSIFRAGRATFAGSFEEGDRLGRQALAQGRRVGDPSADLIYGGQLFMLRWHQGRLAEMETPLRRASERYRQFSSLRCHLALLYADTGRPEEAKKIFDELIEDTFPEAGRTATVVLEANLLAETCALIRDESAAERLYGLLLPYERGMFTGMGGTTACSGSVARRLGLLAGVMSRWEDAERHFEAALAVHAKARAKPFLARTQCEYAAMLLSRGAPADREKACRLLKPAFEVAEELGMKTVAERSARLLREASETTATPTPGPTATAVSDEEILRRDGDYWTVCYEGATFRLRDTKGLQYLAHLLRHPREEFHVADLAAAIGGQDAAGAAPELTRAAGLGDAGELLDPQARADYKQRLEDLRAELDQAEQWSDADRAARLREEIEFLSDELSAAYGLGGRARKGADTAERIRKAVTNRIRDSIARIEKESRVLGEHLTTAVRMGVFCSYSPNRSGRRT